MNIQEFEAIVKQTLGLEGVAEEKSEKHVTWFEVLKKDKEGNVVTDVTYYPDGDWSFETKLKLRKDEVVVVKNERFAFSPDLEDDEYLSVRLYGKGRTLAEAVNNALF